MKPSPETIPIAGDGVTGLRLVILLGDDGPCLFRAIWKIPASGNITDNYGVGDRGNAAAEVDITTGIATRVQWGQRRDATVDAPHPDTGAVITGTTVPHWNDIVTTTLRAARTFPGFRFQHWDVGITHQGTTLYEMGAGDLFDELPGRRGSYDAQLRAFVTTYGNQQQHRQHQGTPRS